MSRSEKIEAAACKLVSCFPERIEGEDQKFDIPRYVIDELEGALEKKCETCKHFNSYFEIYDFDHLEPHDIGECHKGDYPYSPDKCGIGWSDSCEDWENAEENESRKDKDKGAVHKD